MLKNTKNSYGWIAIILHWLLAVLIIGLFVMGIWMRDLGYYDTWYHRAPDLHKSLGLLTFFLLLLRYVWRLSNPLPDPSPKLALWEINSSRVAHAGMYLLTLVVILSGYLIATADDRGVSFFDWFVLPVGFPVFESQEDIAGEIHEVVAWVMMGLVLLHTLASLKHHFIDKDETLMRMLGKRRKAETMDSEI